jgi:hypothetical protein
MVRIHGNVLFHFGFVDTFEDGQSMSNAGNAHLFQLIMLQSDESLPDNFVFWCIEKPRSEQRLRENRHANSNTPKKEARYWRRPNPATKSAHSSAVHSVIMVRGEELLSSLALP